MCAKSYLFLVIENKSKKSYDFVLLSGRVNYNANQFDANLSSIELQTINYSSALAKRGKVTIIWLFLCIRLTNIDWSKYTFT